MDLLESVWPEWHIVRRIGSGSYGTVYEAEYSDGVNIQRAAVKIIKIPGNEQCTENLQLEGLNGSSTRQYIRELVEDFLGEIRVQELLHGANNIVRIDDYKVVENDDGLQVTVYIRMELLTPFSTYISDKKLSEEEIIKLGCDICQALEMCNRHNIIHRDIKPENILVTDSGDFKLCDFGVSRTLEHLTFGLSQKGTINYIAPEVMHGYTYDARADIYSLGVVLYRLLNRNRLPLMDSDHQLVHPNERKNAIERRLHGEALPTPCDATPAAAAVILRACAYDPDDRYRSAEEMHHSLLCALNPEGISAAAASCNERKRISHWWTVAAASAAAVCLLVFVLIHGNRLPVSDSSAESPMPTDEIPPIVYTPVSDVHSDDSEATAADLKTTTLDESTDTSVPPVESMTEPPEVTASDVSDTEAPPAETTPAPRQLMRIEIQKLPEKMTYRIGESLDITGMLLTALFEDGKETVTEEFSCIPTAFEQVGNQTVTVSYGGFTTGFDVTVMEPAVTDLKVYDLPKKTEYTIGDKLDTTGLSVRVKYDNGTMEILKDGFTCWPTVLDFSGTRQITVRYGDVFVRFSVEVETSPVRKQGTLGERMTWKLYENGLLQIYGIGEMEKWTDGFRREWLNYERYIDRAVITDGVTRIEDYAFSGCRSIECVQIPDSVTEIGEWAFLNTTSLQDIIVDENNDVFSSIDGVLFNEDKTEILHYPAGRTDTFYAIPEGVTTIEDAFRNCTNLTEIRLPASLVRFNTVPRFLGADNLSAVTVDENSSTFWSDEDGILYSKDGESLVYYPTGKTETEFILPDHVTTIAVDAFMYTKLQKLIIYNDSVTFQGESGLEGKVVICGHPGSSAERYAKAKNCTFVSLDT